MMATLSLSSDKFGWYFFFFHTSCTEEWIQTRMLFKDLYRSNLGSQRDFTACLQTAFLFSLFSTTLPPATGPSCFGCWGNTTSFRYYNHLGPLMWPQTAAPSLTQTYRWYIFMDDTYLKTQEMQRKNSERLLLTNAWHVTGSKHIATSICSTLHIH